MEIEPTTILRGPPDLYSERYQEARLARLGEHGVVHWTIRIDNPWGENVCEGYESWEKIPNRWLECLPKAFEEAQRRRPGVPIFPTELSFFRFGGPGFDLQTFEGVIPVVKVKFDLDKVDREKGKNPCYTLFLQSLDLDEKINAQGRVSIHLSHSWDKFADWEYGIENHRLPSELVAKHPNLSSPYPTAFYRVFVNSLTNDRKLCYHVRDADKAILGAIVSTNDVHRLWYKGEYVLECGSTKIRLLAPQYKLDSLLFEFLSNEWQTKCELDSVILSRVRQYDDEETGAKKGDLFPLVKIRVRLRWLENFQLFGLDEDGNRIALGDSEVYITGRN